MSHYKGVWGEKGSDGYIQDPFRLWDDWCVCADCDPDREHALQFCQGCQRDIELAENCDHDITGQTRTLGHESDDVSGFVTLASGEVTQL